LIERIDRKKFIRAFYLFEISQKFFPTTSNFIWCLVLYLILVMKSEEKMAFTFSELDICQRIFSAQYFNSYFNESFPENEKRVSIFYNFFFILQTFILQTLQFKIHLKLNENPNLVFRKFLFSRKKNFNFEKLSFSNVDLETKYNISFFLTSSLTSLTLKCSSCSEYWFGSFEFFFPWWRFFYIRECEMEFFEQKMTFESCSTLNRKNSQEFIP